jgi:hypothetical protein
LAVTALIKAYTVLMGKSKTKNHLKDLGIDGRIRLNQNSKKYNENAWAGLICLRIGTSDGFL